MNNKSEVLQLEGRKSTADENECQENAYRGGLCVTSSSVLKCVVNVERLWTRIDLE